MQYKIVFAGLQEMPVLSFGICVFEESLSDIYSFRNESAWFQTSYTKTKVLGSTYVLFPSTSSPESYT